MIRVVVFLIAVGLAALGAAWVADRPGQIALTWLGYRIETSVLVALAALLVLVVAIIAVWSLLRAVLRSPDQVSLFLRHRRAMKGYLAISRGLIAIGAGDTKLARRSAEDAARLSPGDPLALLLTAQSAQLQGDRAAAERAFRDMTERDDTRLLGLRGLYIEAQRRNDPNAARAFAEQAAQVAPGLGWAGQAALDHRCAAGDWAGALAALDAMKSSLDKTVYRRRRAVLLTARALALDDTDRDTSLSLARDAVKLAPGLVPAAALAGRRLAEAGNIRKASAILDAAWKLNPHPDIADAYANVRIGDSARERRARVKRLADRMPDHIESALALSRASLEAKDFAAARAALAPHVAAPTQRVALLMAEIEQAEHGDEGRAREWFARAARAAPDPAWTADGVVSDRWMPVSPVSGRLDAFEWRLPVAEIGIERPLIEAEPASESAPAAAPPVVLAGPTSPATGDAQKAPSLPPRVADTAPGKPPSALKDAPSAAPVIPLVHAPDDPGPDSGLDSDPLPEPVTPQGWTGGWPQRIRQLFR